MTDYVLGFLFSDDRSTLLLIERRRPDWQAGRLNGIGGRRRTDDHEFPAAAMEREFQEETGVSVPASLWHHFTTLRCPGRTNVFGFWAASDVVHQAASTTDEPVELLDYPALLGDPRLLPDLRYLLPMALDPALDFSQLHYLPVQDG